MGFFSKFFRKNVSDSDSIAPAAAAAASPSGIRYDPDLIATLQRDHAELGALYQRIGKLHEEGNRAELGRVLGQFKLRLEAHVINENVRFYNYVEQSMKNDRASVELMRGFRRDMNGIVREVLDFVKKYQAAGLAREAYRDFPTDYATVRRALELRLDSEENNLYPLYKPN